MTNIATHRQTTRIRTALSLIILLLLIFPALASASSLALRSSVSADPVERGERYFYRLTATNTNSAGGAVIGGVTIQFAVPANTQGINRSLITGITSSSCAPSNYTTCPAGSVLTLNLGTLLPDHSEEVQIPVVSDPAIPAGSLPAAISASFSGTYTGNPGGPSAASENIAVVFARPLKVQLSAGSVPLAPGGNLTYSIVFGNTGDVGVDDGEIELRLPTQVSVVDAGGGTVHVNGVQSIVWPISDFSAGTGDRRRVVVTDQSGALNRVLKAEAFFDAVGIGNSRASHLTTVRSTSPLRLYHAVDADPLLRGQRHFNRVLAANTNTAGGAVLEGVTLQLIVPDHTGGIVQSLITGATSTSCAPQNYSTCPAGSRLTLELGTLLPSESREVQVPATVRSSAPLPPFGGLLPLRVEGSYLNNPRERSVVGDTLLVEQIKPLHVSLAVEPAPLAPNGQFVYRLIGSNIGALALESLLTLDLPNQVAVFDADHGKQIGNTLVWDLGELVSGKGVEREVWLQDLSGTQGREILAEARIADFAGTRTWAARSSTVTSARTFAPLGVTAELPVAPLMPGYSFFWSADVVNKNPTAGSSLNAVTLHLIVPDHTNGIARSLITGATSTSCAPTNYSTCPAGSRLTLELGTLGPGVGTTVTIPTTIRSTAPIPPLGSLFDIHLVGSATLPIGDNVQQVIAPVTELIGTYQPFIIPAIRNDFTANGRADMLLRNTANGNLWLYQMNGPAVVDGASAGPLPLAWTIAGLADFNGDGTTDTLLRNSSTGELWIYFMNGSARIGSGSAGDLSLAWEIVGVGDFDRDGKADILVRNKSTGQLWLFLMDGTTRKGGGNIGGLSLAWVVEQVADFDGDGRTDILIRNVNTGQLWMFLMNGATQVASLNAQGLALVWDVVAAGDFNGDGTADILIRNKNTGQLWIFMMDGATRIASLNARGLPLDWAVVTAADYDGDGNADILIRNKNTGQLWMFLMNGADRKQSSNVGGLPLQWVVQ